jgi:hypothetical protein
VVYKLEIFGILSSDNISCELSFTVNLIYDESGNEKLDYTFTWKVIGNDKTVNSTLPSNGTGKWNWKYNSSAGIHSQTEGDFVLSGKVWECLLKGNFTKTEKKEIEWISGEVKPGDPNYETLKYKTERTGSYGTINVTAPDQLERNLAGRRKQ